MMDKIEEISLLESFHFDHDELLMEPENSFTSLLIHSPPEIILQNSSNSVKQELVESVFLDPINSKTTKRKCQEYNKEKSTPKKKKKVVKVSDDREKLPYVHVRARRGEATDSHSLAERARREKINARMKLLQDLVPGCNKVSSTSLVLEEIINHVQSLQLQVEFLSMKLAAVQPKIDINLERLFSLESESPLDYNNFTSKVSPSWCVDQQVNGNTQQIWHPDELLSSGNFGESLKHSFPFLSK